MNKKLTNYKQQLRDEIRENNNKAYEFRKAMDSHERKSKEAQEILELLDKGRKYIDYKNIKEDLNA